MRTRSFLLAAALVAVIGVPAAGGPAQAGAGSPAPAVQVPTHAAPRPAMLASNLDVELCASTGTITMPDATAVPVWGFVAVAGPGDCTTGLVNDGNFPGPTIRATAGDTVTINLTNALPVPTSILLPLQDVTATGDSAGNFTAEASASNGTASYVINDVHAGTYLYESGTNPGIQVAMGLYGSLVVDAAPGQAYGPATAYDSDAVLLLSEIDVAMHADPLVFDLLDYHPTYWLINGRAYPQTTPIEASPGDRVLLRYLNAGFDQLSMSLLGAYQEVVAKEAYEFTHSYSAVAEVVPAGTTADMIVDTAGLSGPYPLYNRNAYVTNADGATAGMVDAGGMLTFLDVGVPVGSPPTAQITSPAPGATVFGDVVALGFAAADDEGLQAVDWNIDGGAWAPATPNGGSAWSAVLDTVSLADGVHTVFLRAIDTDGNTVTTSRTIVVENLPSISIATPSPGATIAGDAVSIGIQASDAEDAAGVLTVEWAVDGGTWQTATPAADAWEANLTTLALSEGAHTIDAQVTDSRLNAATTSISVTVSNVPTIEIVDPIEGASVSGSVAIRIAADDAEDTDASLTVEWNIDGGVWQPTTWNGTTGHHEASWDTPATPGPAVVNARVIDSRTNVATDTVTVTVGANSLHVGDLDGGSAPGGGPNWTASATVTVHDVDEQPVAGATVQFLATRTRKSNGSAATSLPTCTTGAGGSCTVSITVNGSTFEDQPTFAVTGVGGSPVPYDSALNHDPDGDSDGTTIAVPR